MKIIDNISSQALNEIAGAATKEQLNVIRSKYLGKNGKLSNIARTFPKLPRDQKLLLGKAFNTAKNVLNSAINNRSLVIHSMELSKNISSETLDVTLPGIGKELGRLHPVTKSIERIKTFFNNIGFFNAFGNEIEDQYYNFEALNIPVHHPARAMHDTFYFNKKTVLRTHTSGVQIRMLEMNEPPLRMISPGRVYRCDSDATHTPMFHQIEGLCVDQQVSFSDLKGVLNKFLIAFFEQNLKTRFRPSYFPFTEPSAEVDILCTMCRGKGCSICKNSGWLEVLGCGMVHPKVLASSLVNSYKYRGFAFGLGVERLAMLRYGINNLRLFFENDLQFLKQF